MPVRVGDVATIRRSWGRLPTSVRNTCPVCRNFIKQGATSCSCGASFEYIAEDMAQVTSLDRT